MWSHRGTRGLLALVLATGGVLLGVWPGALLGAAPARAADLFVEVNPSTVPAGGQVGIRASCVDNTMPATVESAAFGTVTVQPRGGELAGAAMVPAGTDSDNYRVRLNCTDGRSATTRLNVVASTMPSRGPATGFGGGVRTDPGTILLTGGLAAAVAGTVLAVFAHRRRGSSRALRGRIGR